MDLYSELEVTVETAKELGLTAAEYDKIVERLGRVPTYTELGVYSVMWSEHCSYKNSILQLKTLPREGDRMMVAAGEENAGVIDVGEGYGVAFKIESHNHPSAVEPFQGAATGVRGGLPDRGTGLWRAQRAGESVAPDDANEPDSGLEAVHEHRAQGLLHQS